MKTKTDRRYTALSLILKGIVIVSAAAGVILSIFAGREAFMGGSRVLMYFTIQSNIVVLLISLYGILCLKGITETGRALYLLSFMGAVSITLTGAVFCFVLAPVFGPAAWNIQNVLTHVIVPVCSVADFFVTCIDGHIPAEAPIYGTIPPLLYAAYAGIGYICGWEFSEGVHYPYFFLNWGSPAGAFGFSDELPFMGCVWWILLLFVLLILTGYFYLFLLKRIRRLIGKGLENEAES